MKISLKLKSKIVFSAIIYVYSKPIYLLYALLSTIFIMGFIVWSLNLDLIKYIFFDAPLSLGDKFLFFIQGYKSLFTTFDSIQSITLILFSLLFGINLSLMFFVLKNRSKEKVPNKSGSIALGSAILGGGCIACGTSLLTPLLTTLGITSVAFIRNLGSIFLFLGSILTVYSIYKLSILIGTIKVKKN